MLQQMHLDEDALHNNNAEKKTPNSGWPPPTEGREGKEVEEEQPQQTRALRNKHDDPTTFREKRLKIAENMYMRAPHSSEKCVPTGRNGPLREVIPSSNYLLVREKADIGVRTCADEDPKISTEQTSAEARGFSRTLSAQNPELTPKRQNTLIQQHFGRDGWNCKNIYANKRGKSATERKISKSSTLSKIVSQKPGEHRTKGKT